MKLAILLILAAASSTAGTEILPTPQAVEHFGATLVLRQPVPISIAQPHLAVAAGLLKHECPGVSFATSGAGIVLWDYAADSHPPVALNFLDRQLLTEDSPVRSQSYVLRTTKDRLWIIGGGPEGVLYGAATAAQLLHADGTEVHIPGIAIRDFPSFRFRAAADWLLHVEVNRWALDRGQGWDAYSELARRQIDRAAANKINMALIDGFGWSLEKRVTGYAPVMRELNRYARARGLHLLFGGYGAAYDSAPYPGEYQGDVFYNRESYPDGPIYQCLAVPERKTPPDPRTLGSCRGNDELNRLKAENIARFVDAVEPGALYIHHEDCCVFEDFQKAWLGRCERCRRRWPNDSLLAPDGGAGALAHGYTAYINAVNAIRHPDSNYDAARDTEIVLVSPVYMPATSRSDDWGQVLELWRQIALQLPKVKNVQIGLRETLPQPGGAKRWIELFNSTMRGEGLPFEGFTFVVGGSDEFLTDYAMSGIPAMNAHFLGSRTIYNSVGDPFREPMELIAGEYSWNAHGTGFFRNPQKEGDLAGMADWIYKPGVPAEIFGPGKLFDRVCARLYGPEAGKQMAAYFRDMVWMPEGKLLQPTPDRAFYQGRQSLYLPRTWNYLTAIPEHWNHLLVDEMTWPDQMSERYRGWAKRFDLSDTELHRRLARRWRLQAELNDSGADRVRAALAAAPRADAVADLRYLLLLFSIDKPLLEAVRDFHAARAGVDAAERTRLLTAARTNALKAGKLAEASFPSPVDTAHNEVWALRTYPRKLTDAIDKWSKQP